MSQSIITFKYNVGYNGKPARRLSEARPICGLVGLLVLLLSFAVSAQVETSDENHVEVPNDLSGELPGIDHLVASLSHEASRLEALLTMVVVDHLLEDPAASGQLEARWQDERAWLDLLAARFPKLTLRSSAMDPASWFLLLELDLHQITPSSLVSPQGPDTAILMRTVCSLLSPAWSLVHINRRRCWGCARSAASCSR